MKLRHVFTQRTTRRVIQQFGGAKLIKHRNGEHELVGGSDADRATALEWVSLFAHEIVFTHFSRGSARYASAPFPVLPLPGH